MRPLKVVRMATNIGMPTVDDIKPIDSQKYRCVLRLDSGGMAEVFLAVSTGIAGFNKLFVLKRLRESLAENSEHREMFLHEARLAARLNHPNVVQTYEVGEDDEGIFIAMEYLEGQPLSRVRRELGKHDRAMPHALDVRVVSEVLAGLHYAHELTDYDGTPLRIVHRDVSPQNVFVTYDGQVKLVDFGIAKTHDSGTQAGIFKGKFAYASPEQIRGERIDRRADVFAAGIVLWEMLAGQRLLDGNNPAETFARLLNHPMPSVRSVAPDVDPRLDAIVGRALERIPSLRYETAQAMRDALEEYLATLVRAVRPDDLAQLIGEVFRSERARVQRAIKEELAGLSNTQSNSRVIAARRLPLGDESVSVHASAPVMTGGGDHAPELELVNERPEPAWKKASGWLLAGMAIATVTFVATRPRNPPAAPPVTELPAAPPIATSAPIVAPAAPTPSTLIVATEPDEAHTVAKPKWTPHAAKKAPPPASTTAIAAPPPPPAPPPPTEPSSKEKRKFRVEL